MKRGLVLSLGATILALSPGTAVAQDEEAAAPTAYVLGSYWQCDMNREARADEIMEQVTGPIYQKHVDAGHLLSWGYLGHDTGGAWRRANYYSAADRDQLMAMRNAIVDELLNGPDAETTAEFIDICPTHVDYIWRGVTSSPADPATAVRPYAALSSYYVCEGGTGQRVNELVKDVFKPILDRHVEAGDINSWSWLAHEVGGKYTHLFVADGPDHASILNGLDAMGADLGAEAGAEVAEFAGACGVHQDYLWNIIAQGTAN